MEASVPEETELKQFYDDFIQLIDAPIETWQFSE
jgi:hypothetical protein